MGLASSINKAIDGIELDDYLHFQGISLGETIDSFQPKLFVKGWKLESEPRIGAKQYTGSFAGKTTDLIVSFNAVTRRIGFVMVAFHGIDKKDAEEEIKTNVQIIQDRYKIKPNNVKENSDESYYFELPHGRIICGKAPYFRPDSYAPYIEYVNKPNNVFYIKTESPDNHIYNADKEAALGELHGCLDPNMDYGGALNEKSSQQSLSNQVCWNCGKTIPLGNYCPACGQELFRTCPKCGLKYSSQYHICPKCGTDSLEFEKARVQEQEKQRRIEQERLEAERKIQEDNERIGRIQLLIDDFRKKADYADSLINGHDWVTQEQITVLLPLLTAFKKELVKVASCTINAKTPIDGVQNAWMNLASNTSFTAIEDNNKLIEEAKRKIEEENRRQAEEERKRREEERRNQENAANQKKRDEANSIIFKVFSLVFVSGAIWLLLFFICGAFGPVGDAAGVILIPAVFLAFIFLKKIGAWDEMSK